MIDYSHWKKKIVLLSRLNFSHSNILLPLVSHMNSINSIIISREHKCKGDFRCYGEEALKNIIQTKLAEAAGSEINSYWDRM